MKEYKDLSRRVDGYPRGGLGLIRKGVENRPQKNSQEKIGVFTMKGIEDRFGSNFKFHGYKRIDNEADVL